MEESLNRIGVEVRVNKFLNAKDEVIGYMIKNVS